MDHAAKLFLVPNYCSLDLSPWPTLQAYLARVEARPAVRAALAAEAALL